MDKDAIREAAYSLFAKISFAKTSVADIAAACGLGKGTIYLYFKSKDDIFVAIVEERLQRLAAANNSFFADASVSLAAKLHRFFDDLVDEYFALKDLMFGSYENVQGRILKDIFFKYGRHYEWSIDRLDEIVRRHQPYSERPPEATHSGIATLMELMVGRMLLFLVARDWNDKEGLKAIIAPLSERLFQALVA